MMRVVKSRSSIPAIPDGGSQVDLLGHELTDWTMDRKPQLAYSYEHFALAKVFVFRKWCEQAAERQALAPTDLSGSCKYGSLFMNQVFGGSICGHYEHQYNLIGGRIVDLSHDALDVGRITTPYLHEPDFFSIPEKQASLNSCLPRVKRWVVQFLLEIESPKSEILSDCKALYAKT